MKIVGFVIWYVVLMVPTYFIRFFAIGGALSEAVNNNNPDAAGEAGMTASLVIAALIAGLIFITYKRGKAIGKPWLVVFPSIAFVFDVVLSFIPFVPTLMHLLAIILGCIDNKNSQETAKS